MTLGLSSAVRRMLRRATSVLICLHDWRDEDGRAATPGVARMAHWTCKKCGAETDDWVW